MTTPPDPRRLVYSTTVLALAAICAVGALLSQLGRVSAAFDILSQFAPMWLAGALVAGLAALAVHPQPRRRSALALALAGVVAASALMAPEFLRSAGPTTAPDAPGQIKIIQLNAWARNADTVGAMGWLVAQRPQLIALEEVSPAMRRALNQRPGWHIACAGCPVEILSRTRPVAATILRHGAGLQIMTIARATYADGQGLYSVIAVHWPRATRPGFQQRQERWLSQAIPADGQARTIVVGDFNSTPWSFFRRRWDAAHGLIRRDRALYSWPTSRLSGVRGLPPWPLLPIDHLYAGEGWATVALSRGPEVGSDHYPLVLTLAPTTAAGGGR